MHLCAQISWGGSFRPAFSQLSKLRDQLEPHTRLFGTTATDAWKEIRETAGFHPETQPMRTSIYRSDVYLYMHPTVDEPRTMYKRILFTALEGCKDERLITKMIFFVHDVRETTELRWLGVSSTAFRRGRTAGCGHRWRSPISKLAQIANSYKRS